MGWFAESTVLIPARVRTEEQADAIDHGVMPGYPSVSRRVDSSSPPRVWGSRVGRSALILALYTSVWVITQQEWVRFNQTLRRSLGKMGALYILGAFTLRQEDTIEGRPSRSLETLSDL